MNTEPNPATGEWTVEGKAIWWDTLPIGIAESMKEAKLIAEAHNAALAAKDEYIAEIRTTTYSDLEKQLAAEREASKKLCEIYFNIASETIGEDEVRRRRDAAL